MACVSGTNIVNDGLVFHFDLENGVKSWKGKPTSNLAAGKTWSDAANSFITYNVIEGPFEGSYGSLFADNAASGNITYRISIGTGVLPNATNCNFSIYLKKYTSRYAHMGIGNGCFGGQAAISFDFDTGTIAYNNTLLNATVQNAGNGWFRISGYRTTNTTTYNSGGYFMWLVDENTWTPGTYVPGNCVYTGTGQGFYFASPQFEVDATFASRYINGIRLDTASIIDVSPTQSTITAANLTYRQDDTPTFDGTNDKLSVSHATLNHPASSYTSEAWIKMEAAQSNLYPRIWDKATILVHLSQTSPFAVAQNTQTSSGLRQVAVGAAFNNNIWTHIVTSYDGKIGKIYINGNLLISNDFGSILNPVSSTTDLGIGGGATYTGREFNGEIDQVRLYWDRVLTDAEVRQNFEATRTRYGI